MAEYQFAIRCPSCQTTLRLGEKDLGTKRACPRCQSVLKIPEEVDAREKAAHEEVKHEFSFLCKLCGTRLYGRPSQIGAGISCPDCNSVNLVPTPSKPAAKQMLTSDGDDYELAPVEDRPPPVATSGGPGPAEAEAPHVRFTCHYCHALVYAGSEQIGQSIECPDCQAQLQVPNRPAPRPKRKVTAQETPDIAFAPAADRPQEVSNADSLMSSAMEHVIEKERDRPTPPKHPFGPNVYGFPFSDARVAAFGVIAFLVMAVSSFLIQTGGQSSGKEMVVGMIVWVTGIFTSAVSLVVTAYVATTIVTWAAMGYQKVVEWPPFEALDWLRRALFLFNALAVSSAPGAFVGYMLPGGAWRAVLPLTTTFILFPIVMLSMVSEESPFVPLSRFILASLQTVSAGWAKLYLHAAILLAPILLLAAASYLFELQWAYFTIAVAVYAMLVYFRVMGRLAYVIDEALAGYDDDPDEADAEHEPPETDEPAGQGPRGEPPPIVDRQKADRLP